MPSRLQAGEVVQVCPDRAKGEGQGSYRIAGADRDMVWAAHVSGVSPKELFSGDRVHVVLEVEDQSILYDAVVEQVRLPDSVALRVSGVSRRETKREFVRIGDYLCVEYAIRKGSDREVMDAFRKKSARKAPSQSRTASFFTGRDDRTNFAEVEKEILKVLVGLDSKIDAIVRFLSEGNRSILSIFTPRWVDISGSGVRFVVNEPVALEDLVEVRIQLPDFEGAPVPVLCRVKRVSPSSRKDEPGQEAAMNFHLIEEEDRDRIIRYIFARQRDAIRGGAGRREGGRDAG